ncbi:MAG: hypothetical protein AAFQ98_07135 [Bacteroidota bacterium]
MKRLFALGDQKVYESTVQESDTATFHGAQVHPVCATFALARDMEYAGRLFVLEMTEPDEEGIGTYLTIDHRSPALIGETLSVTATLKSQEAHEVICYIAVRVGERLIATGETGQKILKRKKLDSLFASLQ